MGDEIRYHVNKKTGRAGICRATKKGCPLGDDTPHFNTKEEAKEHIEATEANNNDLFNKFSKNKNNVSQQPNKNTKLDNFKKYFPSKIPVMSDNDEIGRAHV